MLIELIREPWDVGGYDEHDVPYESVDIINELVAFLKDRPVGIPGYEHCYFGLTTFELIEAWEPGCQMAACLAAAGMTTDIPKRSLTEEQAVKLLGACPAVKGYINQRGAQECRFHEPENFTEKEAVAVAREILDGHDLHFCKVRWGNLYNPKLDSTFMGRQENELTEGVNFPVVALGNELVPWLTKHDLMTTVCHEIVHVRNNPDAEPSHGSIFQYAAFEMGICHEGPRYAELRNLRQRTKELGFEPQLAVNKTILAENRRRISEVAGLQQ